MIKRIKKLFKLFHFYFLLKFGCTSSPSCDPRLNRPRTPNFLEHLWKLCSFKIVRCHIFYSVSRVRRRQNTLPLDSTWLIEVELKIEYTVLDHGQNQQLLAKSAILTSYLYDLNLHLRCRSGCQSYCKTPGKSRFHLLSETVSNIKLRYTRTSESSTNPLFRIPHSVCFFWSCWMVMEFCMLNIIYLLLTRTESTVVGTLGNGYTLSLPKKKEKVGRYWTRIVRCFKLYRYIPRYEYTVLSLHYIIYIIFVERAMSCFRRQTLFHTNKIFSREVAHQKKKKKKEQTNSQCTRV